MCCVAQAGNEQDPFRRSAGRLGTGKAMAASTEGSVADGAVDPGGSAGVRAQGLCGAGREGVAGSNADGRAERWTETPRGGHAGDTPATAVAGCVDALRAWAGKPVATLLYDSDVDEFTAGGLFGRVAARQNVAVVTVTADGDVFGLFHTVPVTEDEHTYIDPALFVFSFESHGRCMTPQRFVVKRGMGDAAYLQYWRNNPDEWFVQVGVRYEGYVLVGSEAARTPAVELGLAFEGLDSAALTGHEDGEHVSVRVIAVCLSDRN